MKNIFLSIIIILIFAILPISSKKLSAQYNNSEIKIYLKIFNKRNNITFINKSGFYTNQQQEIIKELNFKILKNKLLLNGKYCENIEITPVDNKTHTLIETKFGLKEYDGSFTISLRENSFFIINKTKLESYILGVVGSEMGESFSIEALKAQAISSRTYYLKRKVNGKPYDIWDIDGSAQVFRGLQFSGSKTQYAVNKTRRKIIIHPDPEFIPYYHSTCGGMLLTPNEYNNFSLIKIENKIPRYDKLPGSQEDLCSESPYYKWEAIISKSKLLNILGTALNSQFNDIKFEFDNYSFLRTVKLTGSSPKIISGIKMKHYLEKSGYSSFRSINCQISNKNDIFHIEGKGFGHFLGMCQYGANGLALHGFSFDQILNFYYPECSIIDL